MKLKVRFQKLHENAVLPKQATEFAGGWDVVCTEIIQESDDFVICKLGWAAEIPVGYKLTLVPRSSLTKTKWVLQNSPGLGDADFRHEYQYRFRAIPDHIENKDYGIFGNPDNQAFLNYQPFPYKVGDRIGQVYIEEVIEMEPEWVFELSDSKRIGGFGSTGK